MKSYRSWLNYAGATTILFGGWALITWWSGVPEQYLPGPITASRALFVLLMDPDILRQEALTLGRALIGAISASVLGIVLALAGEWSSRIRDALRPFSELLRPIPAAALVPITVFAFGFGFKFFLFVVTFVCVWPVYLNAVSALQGVHPLTLMTGRAFGCEGIEQLVRVKLPAALPEIFLGLRLATAHALIAVIVSEMLTGRDGIGGLLFQRAFAIRVADVFALTMLCGLNGWLFNQLFKLLRSRAIGWSQAMATE